MAVIRRKRSLGIRNRIILVTSMCIFAFAAIGGYYFIKRESRLYTENILNQGRTIAGISGVIFTNALVYKELGLVEEIAMTDYLDYYIADIMKEDPRIVYVIVQDTAGRVLSHSDIGQYGKTYTDRVTTRALAAESTLTQTIERGGTKILDVAVPMRISTKSWGVCRVGLSLAGLETQITDLRNGIGSIVSLFMLLSFLFIGFVGSKLTTPLVNLSRTMDRITETGDLEVEPFDSKPRADEIGKLQESFSWMTRRLRTANEERLKTMDLALRAEKMATIGILASGVAHEINNPLGGILLCFRNLTGTDMDETARTQHIEVIESGLHKIQCTVKELLDFARISPVDFVPASVNDLLEESLKLAGYLRGRHDIDIVRRLQPDLPQVKADPTKLCQVFLNLIINAIQAMEQSGTLVLTSEHDTRAVRVTVADTGPGIDQDLTDKIFDPFFTTKGQGSGTGLGLAVSRTFIRQHGGSIEAGSAKGGGAAFTITLPLPGNRTDDSENSSD